MPASRWSNLVFTLICPPLAAVAILFSATLSATASVNQAGVFATPATGLAKSCSGAFRYAARTGNDDIVEISPVAAFAKDRRLARMRYAGRGMSDAAPAGSRLIVLTAMCGAR